MLRLQLIIDDREEFAKEERFPKVDNVICDNFTNALDSINFNKNSYFVIVTRGIEQIRNVLKKYYKINLDI